MQEFIKWMADWSGWIVAIFACLALFYKPLNRWFHRKVIRPDQEQDKKIEAMEERISATESWQRKQQEDIQVRTKENYILITAMKACLEAVSGKKCNGNVDDAIKHIDDFMAEQAHKTKSRMEA